ncbi:Mechanosensitive ion channel-domain-containing protein, partial [Coemansia spiralis]
SNIRDRAMDGGIDMNSNQYAGRLARKLFSALHGDRDYLIVDDFLPFFEKEEDAIKAFEFFDKDGNGDISKKEMRDRVLLIYKERRSLLNALSDMGEVVGKLDMFLTAIALVIIVIIALLVFGLDALKSLATMGTLFIGWSFVFGNTFKTIFECVVFLFQVHAYDVGDIVVIAGDNLTVDKIRLLSTVFFKTDGTYTVYPNNQLATLKIQNLRRSNPQSESIVVAFDFDTPTEKLYALRDHMNEYADDHARDMSSPVGFGIDLLENTNRIQLSIGINYKSNWQDGGKRAAIKLEFSFALRNAITDLGLRYALPLQPVT